ncbi:cobalt-precorrin-5B (C(1))-methyltransferase [Puteibacter caeruleilacunae]|nr:cobalt-precorrin-5B (C(1))-methyltransferase [Puteibacter caeruleilacunae]
MHNYNYLTKDTKFISFVKSMNHHTFASLTLHEAGAYNKCTKLFFLKNIIMILIFGGTTEGKKAITIAEQLKVQYIYSTLTKTNHTVGRHGETIQGGLEAGDISYLCKQKGVRLIINAAHPFATQLHQNILEASRHTSIEVVRIEREYPQEASHKCVHYCDSYDDMIAQVSALNPSIILALTGVKTITRLKPLWEKHHSIFRILDTDYSRELAMESGLPMEQIISEMPVDSQAHEETTFARLQPSVILTKESGTSGFLHNKINAAIACNIPIYVVRRPKTPAEFKQAFSGEDLKQYIEAAHATNKQQNPLRHGYTTGTCATLAAKASVLHQLSKQTVSEVQVGLPNGEQITFPVHYKHDYTYAVVKDAGDDPDVTHGLEIHASVELTTTSGIRFKGGIGVGTFTLPGLDFPPGEPAINKVPRQMIVEQLEDLFGAYDWDGGATITISVPEGERVARSTFNPRLGIEGGISIIGTTGIVKPYSADAYVASIKKGIDVAEQMKLQHIVINSGGKSEKLLQSLFPDLSALSFVQYGNFIGDTLAILEQSTVSKVTMGIMIGKAVKLASGLLDTHSHKNTLNHQFLYELALDNGYSNDVARQIRSIKMAKEIPGIIPFQQGEPYYKALLECCHNTCLRILQTTQLEIILLPPSFSRDGNTSSFSHDGKRSKKISAAVISLKIDKPI